MINKRIHLTPIAAAFSLLGGYSLIGSDGSHAEGSAPPNYPQTIRKIIESPSKTRGEEMVGFLKELPAEEFRSASRILEQFPLSPFLEESIRNLIYRWANSEPIEALEYASFFTSVKRLNYIHTAISGWAINDPESAWKELMGVTNYGANRKYRTETILMEIAERDLPLAIELYDDLRSDRACLSCASTLILRVAMDQDRMPFAYEQIEAMSAGPGKDRFHEIYWRTYGYFRPAEALSTLNKVSREDVKRTAETNLIVGWSNSAPVQCIDFVFSNYSNSRLNELVPYVVREWTRTDFLEDITYFLRNLPSDTRNDASIVGIVSDLTVIDPLGTIKWIESIENDEVRENCYNKAIWSWAKFEPEAAREFILSVSEPELQNSLSWYFIIATLLNKNYQNQYLDLVDLQFGKRNKLHLLKRIALIVSDPSKNGTGYVDLDYFRDFVRNRGDMNVEEKGNILQIVQ